MLLIIDDFETLWPALPQQEEALFAFYNLCLEQKSPRLLLLSQKKVPDLGIHLKDLASRLQNGLSLNLKPLNDQGLRTVLFLHATRLGLHVGQEILDYLLHHRPRSAPILIADLQQLAQASLQDQRRITLPYAKQIFNTPPG